MNDVVKEIHAGMIISDEQLYALNNAGMIISICNKDGESIYTHRMGNDILFKVLHHMKHHFSDNTIEFLKVAKI